MVGAQFGVRGVDGSSRGGSDCSVSVSGYQLFGVGVALFGVAGVVAADELLCRVVALLLFRGDFASLKSSLAYPEVAPFVTFVALFGSPVSSGGSYGPDNISDSQTFFVIPVTIPHDRTTAGVGFVGVMVVHYSSKVGYLASSSEVV